MAAAPADRDELKAAFGRRVRGLREAAHMSQEQLAGRAGLHHTYISSVERGKRNVTLLAIHQLAHGLGVAPSALVDGDGHR